MKRNTILTILIDAGLIYDKHWVMSGENLYRMLVLQWGRKWFVCVNVE